MRGVDLDIHLQEYSWGDPLSGLLDRDFDYLIGSDLLYFSEENLAVLVKSIAHVLKRSPRCQTFICREHRNPPLEAVFFPILHEAGLYAEPVWHFHPAHAADDAVGTPSFSITLAAAQDRSGYRRCDCLKVNSTSDAPSTAQIDDMPAIDAASCPRAATLEASQVACDPSTSRWSVDDVKNGVGLSLNNALTIYTIKQLP